MIQGTAIRFLEKCASVFLMGIVGAVAPASAANIVLNPGFESGATNWTTAGGFSGATWHFDTSYGPFILPHTGTEFAGTTCTGAACIAPDPNPAGAWLYQDLSTVIGQTYSLTFWFASGGTPMELKVLFGSTTAVDLTGIPEGGYIKYSNTATLTASSTTTRLEFLGRQDPQSNALDDIDVEAIGQTGVPEPSAFLLLGSGLLVVIGLRFRRA